MQYRKKPIVITAEQWSPGRTVAGVYWEMRKQDDCESLVPYVVTAHEQRAYLAPGDWVIPEAQPGKYYPCKPDVFAATYTSVNEISDEVAPPSFAQRIARVMHAAGQTTTEVNAEQVALYCKLIEEEVLECEAAGKVFDEVKIADSIADIIVVWMGYGYSRGYPMHDIMCAVLSANERKIDPNTGMMRRREDGKYLKPEGWVGPEAEIEALLRERGIIE